MKILQTPTRFTPYVGGVERQAHEISVELVRRGHDVTVLCANEPQGKKHETIEGVKVKRLPYQAKIAATNISLNFPLEIIKGDYDLIHTHLPTPWSADWSAIASVAKGKPLVLTYHNDIVGFGAAKYIADFYNKTFLGMTLRAAKRIIITQPKYAEYSPYLRKHKDKIAVIHHGVDTERFKCNPDAERETKELFFLSPLNRFHKYKGLDYLLEAIKEVRKEQPEIHLTVGGKGELLEYYREKTVSMGLKDNVTYTGYIPDAELPRYYNRCDAFILPSISKEQEGFGAVLLEAMACEKPVISTEIVGVASELQETNSGIIIRPADSKQLAEAIKRILDDPSLGKEMGKKARRLVIEKYTWKKAAEKTENLYQSLLEFSVPL